MSNHQAIVARVNELIEIPGAERVHVAVVLGEFCVTGKNVQKGDVGILFPEGLQLSEEFVFENNLSRNKEKNKNPEKTGFFEDSRRVRCQPFLKVRSTALFMPLESVSYTGVSPDILQVGVQFDELNGHKICQKYMNEKTLRAKANGSTKAAKKSYAPNFVEHVDTEHALRNLYKIKKGDVIYWHAKLHGTSFRSAKTQTEVVLPRWKQLVNKIVPIFPEFKWDFVTGTRRVVLRPTDTDKVGFHGNEGFRHEVTEKLKPFLTNSMTIYGEIVGYVNGSPIMATHNSKLLKNKEFTKKYGENIIYHYGCMKDQYKFHIYRITVQDHSGEIRDFSQRELEKWCDERQLPRTFEIHDAFVYDGNEEKLSDLIVKLTEREELLGEDYTCSAIPGEGIILRVENGNKTPLFLKSKSFNFRTMESGNELEDREDAS